MMIAIFKMWNPERPEWGWGYLLCGDNPTEDRLGISPAANRKWHRNRGMIIKIVGPKAQLP
jgi:hypothetical protein